MRGFSSLYRNSLHPLSLRHHTSRVFHHERLTTSICSSLHSYHNNNNNNNIPGMCRCTLCIPVRAYNTTIPSSTSHIENNSTDSGSSDSQPIGTSTGVSNSTTNTTTTNNNNKDGNSSSSSHSSSSHRSPRTVRLHNMPRTWMHEEVVEFLHQVAEHAGIEPPTTTPSSSQEKEDEEEEDTTSAVPYVTSPFVVRMHIPFGRRTGIICGSPIIQLTSHDLAHYLLHDLTFDPDDYRNRIYFTEVVDANQNSSDNKNNDMASLSEKVAMEAEQQEALEALELDRYLLAPDLLYDIAKMRQRRLVTRSSKLLLETFGDDENINNDNNTGEKEEEEEEQVMESVEKLKPKKTKEAKDEKEDSTPCWGI